MTDIKLSVICLEKFLDLYTWFIINHGATVSGKVVDINYRRSPLVQGGLEIPTELLCCYATIRREQESARQVQDFSQ